MVILTVEEIIEAYSRLIQKTGDFYIHEHLCRVTGIPFGLYRMSRKELENPLFQSCLRPLTKQDRIRLKSLEKQELYRDSVIYMLPDEQSNVSESWKLPYSASENLWRDI